MAERDPSKVQLDFPQLTADIIAALRLTGTLGLFDMSDVVVPTISVGNIRPVTSILIPPTFTSAGVFSDDTFAPPLNAVLADTGPLPAGDYDIIVGFSQFLNSNTSNLELQHRNAANGANLAAWPNSLQLNASPVANFMPLSFGYTLALNERLRFQVLLVAFAAGSRVSTYIMIHRRVTP